MSLGENGIDLLLQAWTGEFARALAAPLNEYPLISCSRTRHLKAVDLSGVLWWQAELAAARPFIMWVGARESIWAMVGKLNWLRLLEQVQARTLAAINPDLTHPVSGGVAQLVYAAPDTESLCYALAGIRLSNTELPSLILALDPLARTELLPKIVVPAATPMLETLLDLELPLSVALGRATLPIGDVLKFTSGSVIHLQGHTGEEVEILVHGTVVAKGQVVSSKGNYGVRIREIISPGDRLALCTGE